MEQRVPGADRRVIDHGNTDSTNERAHEAITAGTALHGDVHLARTQSAGRGRRGSKWASAAGGLYLSRVLLPAEAVPTPALTMSSGLAVLEAVRELGMERAVLKWPNDVMVEEPKRAEPSSMSGPAKLAGVLVETRNYDPEVPRYVVGIGVNVSQPHIAVDDRAVTCMCAEGLDTSVDEMRETLLTLLERRHQEAIESPSVTAAAYLMALGLQDQEVVLEDGKERRRGILKNLTLKGIVLSPTGPASVNLPGEVRIPLERAHSLRRILTDRSLYTPSG